MRAILCSLLLFAIGLGDARAGPLTVIGTAQPAPGRSSVIAPQVLQPVREVLVHEGDTVAKDAPLIRLDDDEFQADVKAKTARRDEVKAQLQELLETPRRDKIEQARADYEKAQVTARAAQQELDKMEPAFKKGAVPEVMYRKTVTALEKARKDEASAKEQWLEVKRDPVLAKIAGLTAQVRAAEAELQGAQASLDNCTILARTAGVVTGLSVRPGAIVRPGTAVWGEIIDLSEIDIRCELTPAQARQIKAGQEAEVLDEADHPLGRGRVIVMSAAADRRTGKLPVLVRFANTDRRLPCYVPAKVSFGTRD